MNNILPTTEVCDGIDNDFDGQIDEGFPNTDADGQADCVDTNDDNDGYSNATDIAAGSDPLNAASTPEVCDGIDNDGDSLIDEDFPTGNTSCGSDVQITPDGVTFTFPSVTLSGNTTVTTSGTGQPPPSGFKLGASPAYYKITSTATFSGSVEVCINYDETQFATERSLKLFHWEGSWKNITTSIDTVANIICGETTSFSPFIVVEELSTAVTIQNISAHLDGNQVILSWSTSFEIDNEGFIILRAESPGGPFTPITQGMIPAIGGGFKAAYTFTNGNVEQGKTYYYRLQDIDSRGRITAHQIVPVTVALAGAKESNDMKGYEEVAVGAKSEDFAPQGAGDSVKEKAWISVVMAESKNKYNDNIEIPPTLTLPHKGGGNEENGRDDEIAIASGTASPRNDSSSHPHPASSIKGEEYSESSAATTGIVALQNQGPSSLSVTIEDGKGNVIEISRIEDDKASDTSSANVQVLEETDRMILTWRGTGQGKGFVIHRSEKGKDDYTPLSGLIPYFGRDGKEIFRYRFIDKDMKQGMKYDYRLEVVGTPQQKDRPEGLSLRGPQ